MNAPLAILLLTVLVGNRTLRRPRRPGGTPHRMIQTNLREIDAAMDLTSYVATIKDFRADVVLFNVADRGELSEPTACHFVNPHMHGDFTGDVVRRLHAEGIRVIGRFDFSKVNERLQPSIRSGSRVMSRRTIPGV